MPSGRVPETSTRRTTPAATASRATVAAPNGLQASSKGVRVRFSGDKLGQTTGLRTVIDGPFAETKELVAGYWVIQVKSKAEAIEWIKRCPNPHNEDSEIEIRQIFELEDFGPVKRSSTTASWVRKSGELNQKGRRSRRSMHPHAYLVDAG
jgi:hypothetical protein